MFVRVVIGHCMMILDTRAGPRPISIRMNLGVTVRPSAPPGSSANDDGMRAPGKSGPRPTKGHECRANKNAGGEMDGETHGNPRARRSVDHRRAVNGNIEV